MDQKNTGSLNVLVLNASLKHKAEEVSNTEEVAQLVLDRMNELQKGGVTTEIIRLADKNIPVGLKFKESNDDEWPEIAQKLRKADIVIFATPIWWGGRSSLMQRVMERLDAFDEEYVAEGRSAFYNKVAGIVVTGSEDGALSVMGTIMMVLTWMGFTLPPECAAYWVGEVGEPTATDRERRLKNESTKGMTQNLARNLLYYANLLKERPLIPGK
ncbi:MAG TPA: NAD(P)H-dependent oxidoreductase [Candidatus Paceibacterota bacterium]|jgi:multimeric flavodoxin WrbA|nr:NAD(P)H-dependent oxidoreductase [Candidatus Paceibacterota bacterium]